MVAYKDSGLQNSPQSMTENLSKLMDSYKM